jgi:hypothetical protein
VERNTQITFDNNDNYICRCDFQINGREALLLLLLGQNVEGEVIVCGGEVVAIHYLLGATKLLLLLFGDLGLVEAAVPRARGRDLEDRIRLSASKEVTKVVLNVNLVVGYSEVERNIANQARAYTHTHTQ